MADREGKGLGGRIRRYRELAGLSQADLGDKLGVSYQQIQKYERGANRMSVDSLVKVARFLGQPLSAFVDTDGKGGSVSEPRPDYGTPATKEERELLRAWREVSDDKVRAASLLLLKAAGRHR